jgi:AcrR family transcriptional regulator
MIEYGRMSSMDQVATMIIGATRVPQQKRSRASYERMLAAVETLLIERGGDDFSLIEVSKVGKVSIGSIYGRFDSKEDLLRDVQVRALERINADQLRVIAEAKASAMSLHQLVVELVDGIAESLRKHGGLMKPFMSRAPSDPLVAANGKASYHFIAQQVELAILTYSDEIPHPDAVRVVHSAYRILFSTIARYLGFGSGAPADSAELDWTVLKEDLALMISSFLRTPPPG